MNSILKLIATIISFLFLSIQSDAQINYVLDTHTYAEPNKAVVTHLTLTVDINFDNKVISGIARWDIQNNNANEIVFDTKDLKIESVVLDDKLNSKYTLSKYVEYMGSKLSIPIKSDTKSISISYYTSPQAEAIQWLTPQQTEAKKYPFLFTQSEATLARTWLPCQDSPGIRYTYEATIKVPKELMAVMSAINPKEKNETGTYHFKMEQKIPSYLMALAVGDFVYKPISNRTGIFAEPTMIDRAIYEFADIEKMVEAAEKLYGPYRWEQYDVIVLPPSFPFGGMENPRLTFATPTVIAGDRSLVALVAHELAHSWSGNLVTNATWDDFWLNEGFTVYFERRICEALYGKSFSDMEAQLGLMDLEATAQDLGFDNRDTQLKLELSGRDADDGMTSIAYEKGSAFLLLLESKVGRDKLDAFLNSYFNQFAFTSITTEVFIDYLNKNLISKNPDAFKDFNLEEWIYKPGIPSNCPVIKSERFELVDKQFSLYAEGIPAKDLKTNTWSTQEWLRFIFQIDSAITLNQIKDLDNTFHFTDSKNSEIADAWFLVALEHNYEDAYPAMQDFLINVGRRKFLLPLYEEMNKTDIGKIRALNIYKKARGNYHSVSQNSIDEILHYKLN